MFLRLYHPRLQVIICVSRPDSTSDFVRTGLVLKAFLAVLPALLTFMNKRAGMQSKAEIDFGVFQKFFIFQACQLPNNLHSIVMSGFTARAV